MSTDPFQQPPAQAVPMAQPTQQDRTLAMVAHLGGAFFWFAPPLILYFHTKDHSPYLESESKEALNFQLTVTIAYLIGGLTWCLYIGIAIVFLAWIFDLTFAILATIETKNGKVYRYPFCYRFIK